jgi:GcrA cell cycle regulator
MTERAAWATDRAIERLRVLWASGVSSLEIGREFGVSKNQIVGKVHRMGLPSRPSLVKRGSEWTERHERAALLAADGFAAQNIAVLTGLPVATARMIIGRVESQPVAVKPLPLLPGAATLPPLASATAESDRPAWSYPDADTRTLLREILAERESAGGMSPVVIAPPPLPRVVPVAVKLKPVVVRPEPPAIAAPESPPPAWTPRVVASTSRGECCWPIGHPRSRGFRFCGDPAEPKRPYCAVHVRIGYVPMKPRATGGLDAARVATGGD